MSASVFGCGLALSRRCSYSRPCPARHASGFSVLSRSPKYSRTSGCASISSAESRTTTSRGAAGERALPFQVGPIDQLFVQPFDDRPPTGTRISSRFAGRSNMPMRWRIATQAIAELLLVGTHDAPDTAAVLGILFEEADLTAPSDIAARMSWQVGAEQIEREAMAAELAGRGFNTSSARPRLRAPGEAARQPGARDGRVR